MKQLKVFSIAGALLLSVACGGGGGGGGDTVPDIYQGLYWLRMFNGVDYSSLYVTLAITSTTITESFPGVCRVQSDVTHVDGSRIYQKITSSNCSSGSVGKEGWDELNLQGTTLTVNSSSGSTWVYTKIG